MKFYSKIILFGEYVVLQKGDLLAMPFNQFYGNFEFDNQINTESNLILRDLFSYIQDKIFLTKPDYQRFNDDLNKGLYFKSNIPYGYGLGSSGALCAAIYDRYFISRSQFSNTKSITIQDLKYDLSQLENYFHGESSGSDPLVSYLNQPILNNEVLVDKINKSTGTTVFLIDTGKARSTENLMDIYKQRIKENPLDFKILTEFSNKTIHAYLNDGSALFSAIKELSSLQKVLIPEMYTISNQLNEIVESYNDDLAIKLCGAGGGGYLLGFAKQNRMTEIQNRFNDLNINVISLSNMN